MEIIGGIVWIGLSFVVANAARNRNRSYIGYLLLSFLTSPLVAGFIVILLGQKRS
ncbi:MAG: hypothetical protein RBR15_05015 [Sphaerochaeta sp.]|nr:hypothetical protein [Sphaerochaeta sp.]